MQHCVYIILEGVKIALVHSQTYEQLIVDQNPFNTTVTGNPSAICCIQEMSLLLVAFTSGDIGTFSLQQSQFDFHSVTSIGSRGTHLYSLGIEGHFVCMEVMSMDESTNELWCGCNNNTIVILKSLSVEKSPVVSQTIKNISGPALTSCSVLQLRMVNVLNLQLVCALLDIGIVVCYDAALKDCLKRIQTSTGTWLLSMH